MAASGFAFRLSRPAQRTLAAFLILGLGALLAGCPPGYHRVNTPLADPAEGVYGLNFVYPARGQVGVVYKVRPVVIFPGPLDSSTAQSSLELMDASGNVVPVTFTRQSVKTPDDKTQGVVTGQIVASADNPTASLLPSSSYTLQVTKDFTAGGVKFSAGTVLTRFTTRPLPGATVPDGLTIVSHSPGGDRSDGVANDMPYGVFTYDPVARGNPNESPVDLANTVHVTFSEPLDPSSVVLGKTFRFTDPNGADVPGRLYVQGTEVSFQPTAVLTPDDTYTVTFTTGTNGVRALNGDRFASGAGSSFTLTARSVGQSYRQFLKIDPDPAADFSATAASTMTGTPVNVINVTSALIGSNQAVAHDSDLGELVAYLGLASGGNTAGNAFNQRAVTPIVIPAGTQLASSALHVTLSKRPDGSGIDGQLETGPLTITVLNNANAYMFNNPQRTDGLPTAMVMHLDMSMTGADAAGNAVLNQTVLNVTAIGTAVAYNGKLYANAVAQIPLTVANTGVAVATMNLQLILPSDKSKENGGAACHAGSIAGGDCPAKPDTVAPAVIAFSPSACFYDFGSGNGDSPAPPAGVVRPTTTGMGNAAPWDSEANCAKGGVTINSFPVNGSPSVVFTKPIDPTTLQSHDSAHINLTQAGATVPFTAKVEGSSVVLHPDTPLKTDTTYTITAGTALTDLVGNPLSAAATQVFTTKPYVGSRPAPAFVTTINPGLPCALTGGDFTTGGDTAGHCIGDANPQIFSVFKMQANVPVAAYFTKPVKVDSIVAADGCLTVGGAAQATNNPSFALESVDASGQCTGVVKGGVKIAHPGRATTRWFEYVPAQPLVEGQRYWLVVCGAASGTQCVAPHQVMTDVDGMALNTTPTANSGSLPTRAVAATPDMIEPFDAVGPTDNYSLVLQAQPATDTNGNGHFDTGENAQTGTSSVLSLSLGSGSTGIPIPLPLTGYLSGDRPIQIQGLLTPDHPSEAIQGFPSFTFSCSDAPGEVINAGGTAGATPDTCLPFILSAGGMFSLTSADVNAKLLLDNLNVNTLNGIVTGLPLPPALSNALGGLLGALTNNGLVSALNSTVTQVTGAVANVLQTLGLTDTSVLQTGRIMLRMQGTQLPDGSIVPYQLGYILAECKGHFDDAAQTAYDFKPCIATRLKLTANAPDGSGIQLNPTQQTVTTTLVGPLAFDNNGRMVTPLIGFSALQLPVTVVGLPATATIKSGGLHLHLSGYPVHGD